MSEDEKRAIDFLQNVCTDDCVNKTFVVDVILNLIKRQQKELEQEKEKNKKILGDNIENFRKIFAEEFNKYFISKDKIREYIKENKRIYEMKTPNRNRVVYKDCVLLNKEVKELLEE